MWRDMPKNMNLKEFNEIVDVLQFLRKMGLTSPCDFIITWEKKPVMVLNKLGELEFENPEEVYGCVITFWDKVGNVISKTRFYIKED